MDFTDKKKSVQISEISGKGFGILGMGQLGLIRGEFILNY